MPAFLLGLFQILSMVVQLAPGLLTAIRAIIDFIRQVHKTDPARAQSMLQQLKVAARAAKAGDPKPMQDMANSVAVHCSGVACAAELKV